MGPAASVCSTANDMAKWINFVLSGGETSEGEQLIDPAEMSRLWQAENARSIRPLFLKPESPVTDARPTYSLAYSNGYYRGESEKGTAVITHSGKAGHCFGI